MKRNKDGYRESEAALPDVKKYKLNFNKPRIW